MVLPRDVIGVSLCRIVQQLLQEIPQKTTIYENKSMLIQQFVEFFTPQMNYNNVLVFGSGMSLGKNSRLKPLELPGVSGGC